MVQEIQADKDWVRRAFLVPRSSLSETGRRESTFTAASIAYSDTSPGGNFSINPPPQFTRYADLRQRGRYGEAPKDGGGFGRAYYEAIEENAQLLHMQFGVTQFNGMLTFFTGFYNNDAGILARTGRSPGWIYNIGKLTGFVIGFRAFPIVAVGYVFRWLAEKPASKYCYLKPSMYTYWTRVNFILNAFATELKIVKPIWTFSDYAIDRDQDGKYPDYTDEDRELMHTQWPDVFRKDGTIDVYSLSSRAQRLADQEHKWLDELFKSTNNVSQINERLNNIRHRDGLREGDQLTDPGSRPIEQYAEEYVKSPQGRVSSESTEQDFIGEPTGRQTIAKPERQGEGDQTLWERVNNWMASDDALDQFEAEMKDGAQFVSFTVNHLGTTSDTFSNSVGESAIQGKLNGLSSSSRSARFSFSDGTTGLGLVDGVVEAVRQGIQGFVDGIGVSGLFSLFGSSFLDIPQEWKSSTASTDTNTYTIHLRSPSGDVMSRLINLYLPLACILAGALPMSTGRASYTSPFVCQYFHTGFAQCKYGMITNLVINAGVGSAGWTRDKQPLGFDVTFTVTNLTGILHAPIQPFGADSNGLSAFNPLSGILTNDDAFMDYLARLSGRGFKDMYYQSRRLVMNITRKMTNLRSFYSISHGVQWMANRSIPRTISAVFFPATARPD